MVAELHVVFDARRELARARARQIVSGEVKPHEVKIGGAFGLDLSSFRCGLCEGRFAEFGYAHIWYEGEPMIAAHAGCARDEMYRGDLQGWSYDPNDEDPAA